MRSHYKKSLEKITLSDELKQNIINNTIKAEHNRHRNRVYYFRLVSSLAACLIVCVVSINAINKHNSVLEETPNITPRPIVDNAIINTQAPSPTDTPITEPTSSPTIAPSAKRDNSKTKNVRQPISTPIPKGSGELMGEGKTQNAVPGNPTNNIEESREGVLVANMPIEDSQPVIDNGTTQGRGLFGVGRTQLIDSLNDLSDYMGYEVKLPRSIPNDYDISSISVVENSTAEVVYSNDENEFLYRTSKESDSLNDEFDHYENSEIINSKDVEIKLNGNEDLFYNATWQAKDETFTIYSTEGLTKEAMLNLVDGVN